MTNAVGYANYAIRSPAQLTRRFPPLPIDTEIISRQGEDFINAASRDTKREHKQDRFGDVTASRDETGTKRSSWRSAAADNRLLVRAVMLPRPDASRRVVHVSIGCSRAGVPLKNHDAQA